MKYIVYWKNYPNSQVNKYINAAGHCMIIEDLVIIVLWCHKKYSYSNVFPFKQLTPGYLFSDQWLSMGGLKIRTKFLNKTTSLKEINVGWIRLIFLPQKAEWYRSDYFIFTSGYIQTQLPNTHLSEMWIVYINDTDWATEESRAAKVSNLFMSVLILTLPVSKLATCCQKSTVLKSTSQRTLQNKQKLCIFDRFCVLTFKKQDFQSPVPQ